MSDYFCRKTKCKQYTPEGEHFCLTYLDENKCPKVIEKKRKRLINKHKIWDLRRQLL